MGAAGVAAGWKSREAKGRMHGEDEGASEGRELRPTGAICRRSLTRLIHPGTMFQVPHRTMPALLAALPFCLVPALGFAADKGSHGPSEVIFLSQIIALLVCGRLMGELMQRIGQPAVMGQLIAGILLGPSVLGPFGPSFNDPCFRRAPTRRR